VLPDRVEGSVGDPALDERVAVDARELLATEKSETLPYDVPSTGQTVELFIETYPPPPTLLIFGAVHAAQALATHAKLLGFNVIVSDARAQLATEERFPDVDRIIQAWPDDALQELTIEPNTYVAILTHDPKFDEPALVGTLETKARYIGAVGSRKTNRDRRQRLLDAGMSEESLSRIRGPIGLDIGAETPEEMAISILAEIIAIRHGRAGGPLTQAIGNIRGERQGESG
jgi:xanthine dehydrogenase accessory factor